MLIIFCDFLTYSPATKMHCSSISPKLWFRCRRSVVLGRPASHLPCNTNTNGAYGEWRSSSKPAFWMAANAWADVWSGTFFWLQLTSVFPKLKEFMKGQSFWRRERYLHGRWLAGRPRTLLTTEWELWRNPGPSAFSCRRICRKVPKYDVRIS